MPRPQFGLKSIFFVMTLAAVGCVVLPRPIRALRHWLQPPEMSMMYQMVSPRMVIVEEDEALLAIPATEAPPAPSQNRPTH